MATVCYRWFGAARARPRLLRRLSAVLLLVRHGETAANAQGLLLGRADPPLTELGRAQAAALAAALPRPDIVISSPLQRATATAAAFGMDVEIDDRWIELDYGDFDGRSPGDVSAEEWDRWRRDPTYAPPGGESLLDLRERVEPACRALLPRLADTTVVIVSHVSPIKAAIAWALGVPDQVAWRMYVEDAGVARVDLGPDGPVLRWFNRHLPLDRASLGEERSGEGAPAITP
jgi:broad specificity phosphatase PhoE